jgi:glycosyltransferase involved in cell wall biosynthesis
MDLILAYRDRLAAKSEVGFLNRQYSAFARLEPRWLGCHLTPEAQKLSAPTMRVGRGGLAGAIEERLFKALGITPNLPRLRALRPRLVHAQFGKGGAIALPLARALALPLVVTFHGGDAHKDKHYETRLIPSLYQRRMRALTAEAKLFVCVSQSVKAKLLERGFPSSKLMVIEIGIDLPTSEAQAPRHILFAGRFVDKKGILVLLEAVRQLRARGVNEPLVLIGDGPMLAQAQRAAQGVSGVEFAGWKSPAEVKALMQCAHAVCVPSIRAKSGDAEGLPTVAMEAMSIGVPVIASDAAGLEGILEDGLSGRIVPAGDPQSLAGAIADITRDPLLRDRLGAAGRRVARERLSAAIQSRRLEDALLSIIDEAR